jgi:hypothetical protein
MEQISWANCFFFSVETLATVGYGHMYPETLFGHLVAMNFLTIREEQYRRPGIETRPGLANGHPQRLFVLLQNLGPVTFPFVPKTRFLIFTK